MSVSVKSEAILDSDDFEMDDIITEFAKEEMKNDDIVKLSDSDEEMETLLNEFAETQSNSDCDKNKSAATNVILSSSDDDMDDLLEEFREEISSETKSSPVEEKPNLSQRNQSETRTIIIQDSDNNNGTIYDSSVEILVSDDIDNKSEENFALDENEDVSANELHLTSLCKENDVDPTEEKAKKCPNEDVKTASDIKVQEVEIDVSPTEIIASVQSETDLSIDTKNTPLIVKDEPEELDDTKSSYSKNISEKEGPKLEITNDSSDAINQSEKSKESSAESLDDPVANAEKSEKLPGELRSSDIKDLLSNTEELQENNASITEKCTESSDVLPSDECVNSLAAPNSLGSPSVLVKISSTEKSDSETNTEFSKPEALKDSNEANAAIEVLSTSEANLDVLPKDSSVNQNFTEDESLDSAKSEMENLFSDSDSMDVDNKVILKISEKLDDLETTSDSASLLSGSEHADVKSDDQNFLSVGNSDKEDNVDSDVQKVLDNLITKIETTKLCPAPENDCDSTSDVKMEVMDVDLTVVSIVPSVETMKNILASVKLNDSILKQAVEMDYDSEKDGPKLEITNDSSDGINQSEKSKESSAESLDDPVANADSKDNETSLPDNTSAAVSENLNKVSETLPTTTDADSAGESDCEIEEISIIEPEKPTSNGFKTVEVDSKTNIDSTENILSVTEDVVKETLNNHYNEFVSKESKKRKLEVSDEETENKAKRIDNGGNDITPTCLSDGSDDEFSALLHPRKEKVLWDSEKLVVTDKDIEKIALESIQMAIGKHYTLQLKESNAKLESYKVQYQKISEIIDFFRKMQSEFRCSQKVAMLKTAYVKPTFRTVGVNVKICKEIEIRRPNLTKNTGSEQVEIIGEKTVAKETIKAHRRPKTPEKKHKPTFTPKAPEMPPSKSAIDLPSNVVCKEKLLIPENVPQSQPATKKVPVTSATQRTPLPNILKQAISRSVVEPPTDLQPKTVTAPVSKPVATVNVNGDIKGTPRGANVLIPFNEFLQMLPNAGRGFIIPQTRPSSSVPSASTNVVRTIMVPRQDPRLNTGQPLQNFFQNQTNQQIFRGPAFQMANTVQRKPTAVCPVRPMMVQAPTAGNQPQKVAPVPMRYGPTFRNFVTPSGQTTQVFAQYRPASSSFLQPSQPTSSTIHHLPSKPIQSPTRFTSTSLLGSSILRQSLFQQSNQPLIGQPMTASKEFAPLLNTKPYPRVPVSPSYSDTNAKPLPPKPELKANKKDDNKSIVLSWNLALTDKHATVTGYHIFSCQVKNSNNETKGWKKTGEVGAMVLPMACTLQQFENDTSYHFIVRAIDKLQRLGPFSDPVSIKF